MTNNTCRCLHCAKPVRYLEAFPPPYGRGVLCLSCYAQTPLGRQTLTADEIVALWSK